MNVAPSNATPLANPTRIDPTSGPTRVVLDPDSGSVDTPVAAEAKAGDVFGRLLSRELLAAAGNALDATATGLRQAGDPTAPVDAAAAASALAATSSAMPASPPSSALLATPALPLAPALPASPASPGSSAAAVSLVTAAPLVATVIAPTLVSPGTAVPADKAASTDPFGADGTSASIGAPVADVAAVSPDTAVPAVPATPAGPAFPAAPAIPAAPTLVAASGSRTLAATPTTGRMIPFGVGVTDLPGGGAVATRQVETNDEAANASPAGVDGAHDAAASNLAAQLALVSQWAGLTRPPVSTASGPADSLATQDKLATVRGTSTNDAPPAVALRRVVAPDASNDALAPSLVVATLADTKRVDRGDPGTAESIASIGPGARKDVAQARPDAVLASADGLPSPGDGSPGRIDAANAFAAAAPGNAFLAHVTAAVTSAAAASSTPSDTSAPTVGIREPVGTPAWSREVGQATLRLAADGVQTASLQLNPEHLGPLDVQVRIDNGVAHLAFNAAHADTRQAIEASRPALDQLFAGQSLKIGDCAVGDASTARRGFDADTAQAGQSHRDGSPRQHPGGNGRDTSTDPGVATLVTRLKAIGTVDTFA